MPSESRLLCEYYEHHCPEIRLSKVNVKSKQRSKEEAQYHVHLTSFMCKDMVGFLVFFKKTQKPGMSDS